MNDKMDKDLLWKQYELNVGLYKHYLELVLRFNTFYYGITGAILSFYLSKQQSEVRYALLFLFIMSIGFAGIMFYSASQLRWTRQDMFDLRDKLGFAVAPEFNVLAVLLRVSGSLLIVVAIGLLLIFHYGI